MNYTRFAGSTIELGAQWLFAADPAAQGQKQHAVYEFALQCGLQFVNQTYQIGYAYTRDGENITNSPELASTINRFSCYRQYNSLRSLGFAVFGTYIIHGTTNIPRRFCGL